MIFSKVNKIIPVVNLFLNNPLLNCILEEHKNKHILYFFFPMSVAVSLISLLFGSVLQTWDRSVRSLLTMEGGARRNHLATKSPEIPLNHWLLFVISWLSKKLIKLVTSFTCAPCSWQTEICQNHGKVHIQSRLLFLSNSYPHLLIQWK